MYALIEPGTAAATPETVRYIGSTRKPLRARLAQHLRRPAKEVEGWITSLPCPPSVVLLDDLDGATAYEVIRREHERISEWRAAGARLLNTGRRPRWADDDLDPGS